MARITKTNEEKITVEETPGAKTNGQLREADLGGHLINDKEKDKDAKPDADKANGKNGKNGNKDDDTEPGLAIADYTSAKDRQFAEAIKRLGGKPPVAPAKDLKAAADQTAADPAAPSAK